jgi:hypothetical protein
LIKVSCAMASSLGYAAFPGCECATYTDLLEQLPAHEHRLFRVDAETLRKEIEASIHAIEAV